jgi:uncharacterized protein (TIGR02118 family)
LIKVLAAACGHPLNRQLSDFHRYWAESHGPLFANTGNLRRYVQHLTLPEAYGGDPAPTWDGCSMFWYDDVASAQAAPPDSPDLAELIHSVLGIRTTSSAAPPSLTDPREIALFRAVLKDDAQLFDRTTTWPMHHKRSFILAEERAIVDAPAKPSMVKVIFAASKLPGLTLDEFFVHWQHEYGPAVVSLPGLRRYVQNHGVPEAYAGRGQTHDGWSELWFDDLDSLHAAARSPEWAGLRERGTELFAQQIGIGVARERVQKEVDWSYNDWGVGAMSADEIRSRLAAQRFAELVDDPDVPRKLTEAAARNALAVWTSEHLVTLDASGIDARPEAQPA